MYALLIADDSDDVALFSLALQRAGLSVTTGNNLERAMQSWLKRPADIVLVALPQVEPHTIIRRVRAEAHVPLIVAVDSLTDRLHAELLRQGADLVVALPTSLKLLIAQIGVLMRRTNTVPAFSLPTLGANGFSLDPTTRTVTVSDKPPQRLTHLEFRLLYTLMLNRGQVIPTETIVEHVWGYTGQGDRDLIRGLVSRLRAKVETDPRNPRWIVTTPGIGYAFSDDPD
ncbi:MAG: DNA-binding response regulator [Chloroflexi bacterium]|nr:MAG: DNA-binding response regulator [Chloroflexota bacterium]